MTPIVITAGHSATDPGASAHGHTEAALMLDLRDRVAAMLRAEGAEVITDGASGQNLPLRQAIALIQRGALAVELHTNASSNPAARGVEAISLPRHKPLAQRLAGAVADTLGTRLRGAGGWIDQAQTARGRLGYVNAGGIVLEVFFISNATELGFFLADPDAVAWAIAAVLLDELEGAA